MRYSGINKKRQFSLSSVFLLFVGISGMIFSLGFDFLKTEPTNFGFDQLAGFIVSTIIALVGIRKIAILKSRIWDGLLLLVYLAGILFMGLRSDPYGPHKSSGMLQDLSFDLYDVLINILGFIPLGYLMSSYFLSNGRMQKKVLAIGSIIASCIVISLLIELSQYYLPGRTSSLLDLLSNGLGAFTGITYYLLEKRLSQNK